MEYICNAWISPIMRASHISIFDFIPRSSIDDDKDDDASI